MRAAAALFLVVASLTKCHGWVCAPTSQPSGAVQIDAGQGQVVATNDKNEVFFLSGSTWSPLGSVPLKHVSVGAAGIWGVDNANKVYKYGGRDFVLEPGQELQQVDAGDPSQIVGVTNSDTAHCAKPAEAWGAPPNQNLNWVAFPGQLTYLSCSSHGCWGMNSQQNIFFTKPTSCQGVNWIQTDGAAGMAEVGADGSVFVVNSIGQLSQRTGISHEVPQGAGWLEIAMPEPVKHASYDLGTLWVVTTGGVIMKCAQ